MIGKTPMTRTEVYRRHRAKKAAAGLCVRCSAPRVMAYLCSACSAATHSKLRALQDKRKALGLCVRCGGEGREGRVTCESCKDKQVAKARARREGLRHEK